MADNLPVYVVPDRAAVTPLGRALRRIADGTRLSSLDVPVLEDAADEIDALTASHHALLAACRAVAGVYEGCEDIPIFAIKVRAAIARAEGR